jgi:hypothetical protein
VEEGEGFWEEEGCGLGGEEEGWWDGDYSLIGDVRGEMHYWSWRWVSMASMELDGDNKNTYIFLLRIDFMEHSFAIPCFLLFT